MTMQYDRLADIQYVPSTVGSIYANPASTRTYIRGLVLYNGNSTSEDVDLHNVPDASGSLGTAGAGNRFARITLVANETLVLTFPHPLVLKDTNDSLQADAITASKVTVQILGDIST